MPAGKLSLLFTLSGTPACFATLRHFRRNSAVDHGSWHPLADHILLAQQQFKLQCLRKRYRVPAKVLTRGFAYGVCMFCRHLNGARRRTLQPKLPDSFEQSGAFAILKKGGTETKQLAQSINHRSCHGYLAVRNPGIVPDRQVSEANVQEGRARCFYGVTACQRLRLRLLPQLAFDKSSGSHSRLGKGLSHTNRRFVLNQSTP